MKTPKSNGSISFVPMLNMLLGIFRKGPGAGDDFMPRLTNDELRFIARNCVKCRFDYEFLAELERCFDIIDPMHLRRDAWKIIQGILSERRMSDEMSELHRYCRGEIKDYAKDYAKVYALA